MIYKSIREIFYDDITLLHLTVTYYTIINN